MDQLLGVPLGVFYFYDLCGYNVAKPEKAVTDEWGQVLVLTVI
jgi:3-hydroxyacyl-CoA dehydrogenase